MDDPDLTPNTIDVLAPNLAATRPLKQRWRPAEVRRATTLEDFIPPDRRPSWRRSATPSCCSKRRSILSKPCRHPVTARLGPRWRGPRRSCTWPRRTLARQRGGQSAGHRFAALASGTPADRARAAEAIIPPLKVTLDQMRLSLQAQPVGLGDLPKSLVGDWLTPDGRARIQLFPSGGTDNAGLMRFTRAVRSVAPTASGLPISTQEAAGTVARAFVQAGLLALAADALLLLAVLRSVREVAFTLAPVVLSGFLTLGSCVLIGPADQLRQYHRFPAVVRRRRRLSHLLRHGLARRRARPAAIEPGAGGVLFGAGHRHRLRQPVDLVPSRHRLDGKILMISLAWTLVCALIFEPALLGPPRDQARVPRER